GGRGSPTRGGSTKGAQKFKRVGPMRGLFALATFPVSPSRRARARSPRSPPWATALAFNKSPRIDFTGESQSATTRPHTLWASSREVVTGSPASLVILFPPHKLQFGLGLGRSA